MSASKITTSTLAPAKARSKTSPQLTAQPGSETPLFALIGSTATRRPPGDLAYCDNLQAFLIECSTADAEAQVEADVFYAAYKRWAKNEGLKEEEILNSIVLGRAIRDKNYGLTSERDKSHSCTLYKGRRLNDLGPHAARRAS
mgnify:FL=1